jgi:GT2 family glycosyltransferase
MSDITVVIATRSADEHLGAVLRSLDRQSLAPERFAILVVEDGPPASGVARLDDWPDGERRQIIRQRRCGPADARNLGLFMADSPLVLFLDDDEVAGPDLLAEHVRAHASFGNGTTCVVGSSAWSPAVPSSPLVHFLRNVDRLPLGYPDEPDHPRPDFTHFRARQLSARRELLARHAVFDARFAPLDDVELGYRLRRWGGDVHHWPGAASTRTRGPDLDAWSEQSRAEGRAIAHLAAAHPTPDVLGYCRIGWALDHWRRHGAGRAALRARIRRAETEIGPDIDSDIADSLWIDYRACFDLDRACGVAEVHRAERGRRLGIPLPW